MQSTNPTINTQVKQSKLIAFPDYSAEGLSVININMKMVLQHYTAVIFSQLSNQNCPGMLKDTFASYWLSASGALVGRMPAQWLVRADWLVCPGVKTNDNACEYYICNMESFFENALFPDQGVIVSIVPFRRSLPYCFGRKDIVFIELGLFPPQRQMTPSS